MYNNCAIDLDSVIMATTSYVRITILTILSVKKVIPVNTVSQVNIVF